MKRKWIVGLALVAVLATACKKNGSSPPPTGELPTVTLTPPRQDLTATEDAQMRAEARFGDGTPATGGEFRWRTFELNGTRRIDVEATSPEPGVSEGVIPPPGGDTVLQVLVLYEICDADGARCMRSNEVQVVVTWFGGTATLIVPPTESISLAVGERRPYQPFAIHEGPGGHTVAAPSGLAYAIADPSIARVDERGVLSGVATGETTLTIRGDAVSVDVPVSVIDAELGPPPDGRLTLSSVAFADLTDIVRVDSGISRRMGVDARGWPTVMYRMVIRPGHPVGGRPIYISAWTGTGFGFELVTPLVDHWPEFIRMDVDGGGAPYVVWFYRDAAEGGFLRVAHRAVDAFTEWSTRDLPVGPTGSHPLYAFDDIAVPGVLGRREGGAWVAYSILDEPDGECISRIRLADVTADRLEVEDVYSEDIPPVPMVSCHDVFDSMSEHPLGLHLAPPTAGSPRPQLIVRRPLKPTPEGRQAMLHRHDGSRWERRRVLPYPIEIDPDSGIPDDRTMPTELSVAWHDDAEGDPFAAWQFIFAGAAGPTAFTRHATLNSLWDQVRPPREMMHGEGVGNVFALAARDHRYIGAIRVGPLVDVYPDDFAFLDDALSAFFPETDHGDDIHHFELPTLAYAGRGARLHFVWQQPRSQALEYGVVTTPVASTTDDAETRGRRLGPDVSATIAPTAVRHVMADGTRLFLRTGGGQRPGQSTLGAYRPSDDLPPRWPGVTGQLMRSDGPDDPFAPVESTLDGLSADLFHMRSRGDVLYVINSLVTAEVWRSDDRGRTWSMWRPIPGWRHVDAVEIDGNGTMWLTGGAPGDASHLVRFVQVHHPTTSLEEIDLTGTPFETREAAALRITDDRVHLLAFSLAGSRIATFDLAGTLMSSASTAIDDPGDVSADPIAVPDGWLWHGRDPAGCGSLQYVLIAAPDLSSYERVDLPGCWTSSGVDPMQIAQLTDGRIVIAGTMIVGRDEDDAVYLVSDDGGRTWSDPTPLLPAEGGRGEHLGALLAEPSGGLLAFVGNDQSMRGFIHNDVFSFFRSQPSVGAPVFHYSVVRVDAP